MFIPSAALTQSRMLCVRFYISIDTILFTIAMSLVKGNRNQKLINDLQHTFISTAITPLSEVCN